MVRRMGNQGDKPGGKPRLKDTRLDAGRKPMESLMDYWVRLGLMKATPGGMVVNLGRPAPKPRGIVIPVKKPKPK
jgi:hypothetical protein